MFQDTCVFVKYKKCLGLLHNKNTYRKKFFLFEIGDQKQRRILEPTTLKKLYIIVKSAGRGKQQNLDEKVNIFHKFTKENIDKVNDSKIEGIPPYANC